MLTDPEEIKIISKSRQKNVRDPNRSREHFENIFGDFFVQKNFSGKTILDLGPGQYDFGVMAKESGATVYGIDNDEAVIELGNYKNIPVVKCRMKDIKPELFPTHFDGLFCKFSINAFWHRDSDTEQMEFIERLLSLLKPDGWLWIAPWNGMPKSGVHEKRAIEILSIQAAKYQSSGVAGFNLTQDLARRYGINGKVANNALFIKNLVIPASVVKCDKLL